MEKFVFKASYHQFDALIKMVLIEFPILMPTADFSEKCCLAVLYKWIGTDAVQAKLAKYYRGEKKIQVSIPVACALAYFIQAMPLDQGSYLGNYLQIIFTQIHQQYTAHDTNS